MSPLGVVRRNTPPVMRAVRLLVLVVCAVAFLSVAAGMFGNLGGLAAIVQLILLGGTFLAMNLVGPWVVSVIGRVTATVARRASTLLAGRRLVDDPRSAWRTVAGIALTGFVAGFIALVAPPEPDTGATDTAQIEITATATQKDGIVAALEDHLPPGAVHDTSSSDPHTEWITAEAPTDIVVIDELRTALSVEFPGVDVVTSLDEQAATQRTFEDTRTGILVVLSVSMLIAMVSAAISGSSAVLDRRRTYALLHLSGTPMTTLNTARRTETLIPLTIMGGGSILTGMLLATPFISTVGLSGSGAMTLGATVGLGLIGILSASALSRPLLRSVMVNATPRSD